MKTRVGRLFALMAVCAGAAFALFAPTASAAEVECTTITGSGSSLQGNLQTLVWIPGFKAAAVEPKCKAGTASITYKSTGSGKGKNCWGAKKGEIEVSECGDGANLDAYIDADVGPEAQTQMANIDKAGGGNEVVTVPVAQSAIAVIVSLPVGCEPNTTTDKPRVVATALEEEWFSNSGLLGQQIKTTGGFKGAACQTSQAPELFARSKGSGTTAGFKRFLGAINPTDWAKQTKTVAESESAENWPKQVKAVDATSIVQAENVYKTPNSESYVDVSDARAAGFAPAGKTQMKLHKVGASEFYSFYVEVQNTKKQPTSEFAEPEETSGEANCSNVKYSIAGLTVAPNVDWSHATQEHPLAAEGLGGEYPICTLTFDLAWHKYGLLGEAAKKGYPNGTAKTADTVLSYLTYIVKEGQAAKNLTQEHFGKLPKKVEELAITGVNSTNIAH